MSILWETNRKGVSYSVRSAGGSIRLYSNGVYHSQWNQERPFAGAVWDCLALPALYNDAGSINRILVLGLGGGAVVRQLQTLVSFKQLIAVEIDPVHIKIAKRWFGVNERNVEIVEGDAIDWLKSYRGAGFDLVIDDIFGDKDNEPIRAQALNKAWVAKLKSVMNPEATLVANCISKAELRNAVSTFSALGFRHGYRWSLPEYDNAIGVFFLRAVPTGNWVSNLEATSLSPAMKRAARWVIRRPIDLD